MVRAAGAVQLTGGGNVAEERVIPVHPSGSILFLLRGYLVTL